MQQNQQKVYIIVPIMVVIIIFAAYFFEWDIATRLNKDSTATNIEELSAMIDTQISEGKKRGSFFVSNVTMDDISKINDYVVNVNGKVDNFLMTEKSRKGYRVTVNYDISDNYYVYQKYVNGKEIPSDRPAAYKLYAKVDEILSSIITPDMTDYEKEQAIHDYIVTNCEYGYTDYSKEYAYCAYGALVQNKAVCEGYAQAISLLLNCVGVENTLIVGEASGEPHAWNQVKIDNKWYQLDATWNDPVPDKKGFASHMYFNVTDDILDDTHTWNSEQFNVCNNMDYNYFVYNDLIYSYDDLDECINDFASSNITATIEVIVSDFNEHNFNLNEIVFNNDLVQYFSYFNQPYGENEIVTIFLNQ